MRQRSLCVLALAITLPLAWLPAAPARAATGPVVVASGLDDPRGLALDGRGRLVVGEAGHAGPVCTAGPGELGPTCVGFTSRISTVDLGTGTRRTLADGFPSIGTAVGATGIDGVTVNRHKVYGIITGSPQGVPADACGAGASPGCSTAVARATTELGDLVRVLGASGRHTTVADVGAYDYQWVVTHKAALGVADNPDFQPGDANPYGVTAGPAGGFYVADAGSNTLDYVSRGGAVTVLAYLPDPPGPADQRFPYDAVPTCVATAPGGAVWVGTLSGRVFRWDGHAATLVADRTDGLTALNGCGTDAAGNLYASNIFGVTPETFFAPHTGFVSRITPSGAVTTVAGSEGLSYPAGIAVAGSSLYVAVQSICPKDLSLVGPADPPVCDAPGQVVRLAL